MKTHPYNNQKNQLMKGISIFLIAFAVTTVNAQTTVYIDPDVSDDAVQDGSLENPYNSYATIAFESNTTYLQKRGTVFVDSVYRFRVIGIQNVMFGAYGNGKRPIIRVRHMNLEDVQDILIKDLEINPTQTNWPIIRLDGINNNLEVNNCILHGSNMGIEGWCNNMKVLYTEIYNILRDAFLISNSDNVEIGYCHIHDINQIYHSQTDNSEVFAATGDGIQFEGGGCDNYHIHHCIVDRINTGNKFGVISTGTNFGGIIEFNHFIGPQKTPNGGACFHPGGSDYIIRNNIFENSPTGIYNRSSNLQVYYNIFLSNDIGIYVTGPCKIYNNVFYDNKLGIQAWLAGAEIMNNVFYLLNNEQKPISNADNTLDANIINMGSIERDDTYQITDPDFIDPENYDFHIGPGSPCIDKGVPLGLTLDFDSAQVPVGALPDIGAYEYDPNNSTTYNHTPVAMLQVSELFFLKDTTVNIYGDMSYDEDGDSISYAWTFPHIISVEDRYSDAPSITIPDLKRDTVLNASLRVSDGRKISRPYYFKLFISNELDDSNDFMLLYPNPARDILNMKFLESIADQFQLTFINSRGQMVFTESLNSINQGTTLTFAIPPGLLSGINYILLRNDDLVRSGKFIVY
jgi:hypothetical protein